jgi:hypothetical protein
VDLDDLRRSLARTRRDHVADLRRQRAAVPDLAFAQFPRLPLGLTEGSWLPRAPGSMRRHPKFTDGEPVWVGRPTSAANAAHRPSSR